MRKYISTLFVSILAVYIVQFGGCYGQIKVFDIGWPECNNATEITITSGDTESGTNSSGILSYDGTTAVNCTYVLVAPLMKGIVLSVFQIELHTLGSGIIIQLDNKTLTYAYGTSIAYDYDEKLSFRSEKGARITIVLSGPQQGNFNNFQITFTAYTDWSDMLCLTYGFPCKNGICVSVYLKCDGHNHCGDRSEQKDKGYDVCGSTGLPPWVLSTTTVNSMTTGTGSPWVLSTTSLIAPTTDSVPDDKPERPANYVIYISVAACVLALIIGIVAGYFWRKRSSRSNGELQRLNTSQ